MTRIKRFDRTAILNRNRVLRNRIKKKLMSEKVEKITADDVFQESINSDDNIPLREKLRLWASNYCITGRAINGLLAILNESGKY